MLCFSGKLRRICFTGSCDCNQGGGEMPIPEILNGVVDNGILVSNQSVIVVHTGG